MRFILTADWHLSDNRPRCRKDEDWIDSQRKVLAKLAYESSSRKCPIIAVGDIFNKAVVSEKILNLFFEFTSLLLYPISIIAGNHDLPGHSMELLSRSSIGVVFEAMKSGMVKVAPMEKYSKECSWANFGEDITNSDTDILFTHRLVFRTPADLPPNVDALTAQELLELYPRYKWIFTGDNHTSFIYKKNGRYVINPGHLTVRKSDEVETPVVYYIDTDTEEIESIEIEDKVEIVVDSFSKKEEEREDRIEAFMEAIENNGEFTLSFEDNIEMLIESNKSTMDTKVIDKIRELMGVEDESL